MLKKIHIISIILTFPLLNCFCKEQVIDWNKSLPPSPKLTSGVFKNGIKYHLYPTFTQKGKISLRLLVNAGAAMETDTEDGIAHFIEHMTFNGSENFKPGTLIHYFQDNGIKFGNDTNAFTHYFYTCYQIDLPKNDKENVQKGLQVLHDQGFGCLFLPEEINRERGVILSEMRTRDSAIYRAYKAIVKFMLPEAIIANRFIIGTENTINNFTQSQFKNFYDKWYTPHRMTLVVTGDFKTKEMLSLLQSAFDDKSSTLQNRQENQTPEFGPISFPKEKFEVSVYQNSELPVTNLTLQANRKVDNLQNNLASLKEDFAWLVMTNIIKHRLEDLQQRTDITEADFNRSIDFQVIENAGFSISCNAKNIIAITKEIEKFTRKIESFGFSFEEIESGKKALQGKLTIDCGNEENDIPACLADGIIHNLMQGRNISSAQQDLDNFSLISPFITPEYCSMLWKELWRNGAYLFISTPSKDIKEDCIKQAFFESKNVILPIPNKTEQLTFHNPFINRNKVKILHSFKNRNLGVENIIFDNNIRINLKKTNFEKDRILVNVALGSGLLDLKDNTYPGINLLLGSSFIAGGLKQCSHNDLKRFFDGKLINLDFDVEEDSYTFKCVTNRECFKEQMQLIGAYLTEPGYREEGLTDFKKMVPVWYDYFEHNPEGLLRSQVTNFLTCEDARFGYPEQSILVQRNFDEARKVLAPVLDKQYMEITIVGDFDRATIIKQLQETVGQLAKRAPNISAEQQTLPFPKHQTKVFSCKTELDKSIIHIVWPTESLENVQNARTLEVLSDILRNTLLQEIRQTMGDTYSPKVINYQSETFKNRGHISALVVVATEKIAAISEKIYSIVDKIVKNGISKEDLDRSIKPLISSLEKARETNLFWLNWIKNIQQHPQKNTWELDNTHLYKQISVEDVNQMVRKYLNRNTSICTLIKPENKNK